jgi:hypothetical protein
MTPTERMEDGSEPDSNAIYIDDSDEEVEQVCYQLSSFKALEIYLLTLTIKVYYSANKREVLKWCFSDMLEVMEMNGGVHPKMAKVLDRVFQHIEKVGGDIGTHK